MKVEIWSDVVCPWCYIGKRRLEEALDGFPDEVQVVWRSFELDPSAPEAPPERLDAALAAKYGTTLDGAREMMAHLARVGAGEGLELNFDRARRGNTLDAHRLLHFSASRGAQSQGAQSRMKERLFRAYMTEGRPISHRAELVLLAEEVGLDGEDVRAMLETDAYVQEVRQDEARAREMGIRGVPFFLIDGRIGVAGAQPSHLLRDALRTGLKPAGNRPAR
jgi:predicted DsbA family dithiol-disulfide isomerase